jgi:hypothetical protein
MPASIICGRDTNDSRKKGGCCLTFFSADIILHSSGDAMKKTFIFFLTTFIILAVLILPGCKNTIIVELNGIWEGRFFEDGGLPSSLQLNFIGEYNSGYVKGKFFFSTNYEENVEGHYEVFDSTIEFNLEYIPPYWPPLDCKGTILDDDNMSGTWRCIFSGEHGTWFLKRM